MPLGQFPDTLDDCFNNSHQLQLLCWVFHATIFLSNPLNPHDFLFLVFMLFCCLLPYKDGADLYNH